MLFLSGDSASSVAIVLPVTASSSLLIILYPEPALGHRTAYHYVDAFAHCHQPGIGFVELRHPGLQFRQRRARLRTVEHADKWRAFQL